VARDAVFADRVDAGKRLAIALTALDLPGDALVCGIPRGGIVVAAEVARVLELPLRAIIARKVGAPRQAELAVGAVGPGGEPVLDDDLLRRVGATPEWIEAAVARARGEIAERVADFPKVVDVAAVAEGTVVVVDDGVATGSTAAAAGRWLGHAGTSRRVLALPVGPSDTLERLRSDYDEVLALAEPAGFFAVGQWYRNFDQVTDDEVRRLLSS